MVNTQVNWILSDKAITINYNGVTHVISRSDVQADKLIQALKNRDFDTIPNLISIAKCIEDYSNGVFQVKGGKILIDGVVVSHLLGQKIKSFYDQGLPYEPLVAFARKLQENPSKRAVDHLYEFLEKNNIPLTETGDIICYKKVNDNFTDKHTGTLDNSPGQVLIMPRNQVDEDPDSYCSFGYHCSNYNFANNFGSGKMLEVEVNPKNVVAIPRDSNGEKMRVCEYRVLREVDQESSDVLRTTKQTTNDNSDNIICNSDEPDTCERCSLPFDLDCRCSVCLKAFTCECCQDCECHVDEHESYINSLCDCLCHDDCQCEACENKCENCGHHNNGGF